MSKFFLFSKINKSKPQDFTTKKWYQRISLNYFSLNVICLSLIVILFVVYLGLVNDTSRDGFTLDDLQTKLSKIQEQNSSLDLQVHNLQSMEHIKTISQNYSFEEIKNPEYLSGSAAVAFNE